MYDGELFVWRNLMENGTQCLGEEQYLKAESFYIQSLLKAYQLSVPEIVAFTLRLLATVRVRLGNLEFAEDGFKEALLICQQIQNTKGMSEAWAGLASVSVKKRKLHKAAVEYQKAISLYPSSSPQLRLGMLYADLGQVYTAREEWARAKRAFLQAQELCRLHGFLKGDAELEVLLGELYFRQGKIDKASETIKHACQLFAQIADLAALSGTLQYLALLYFEQNEMLLAFECQQRAVALCLRYDTSEVFSESCYFLSKIEQLLEDNQEAKLYLELSIEFYPKQDMNLALRYHNLASMLFVSMDLTRAELYYRQALNLFELSHDQHRVSEVRESLAILRDIQERKGDPLLQKYRDNPDERLQVNSEFTLDALVHLAEFYEKRNHFRDALDCYWKALEKGRDSEVATDWIEMRVQKVSKRLRKKK